MDHNKRNRFCWEIESVNDSKIISTTCLTKLKFTIDTTAVFLKTKSFRQRCHVKFGAQHTPYDLSQRFSELVKKKHTIFPQNQHFSYTTLNDAQRCALPCLKKVPFLIVFLITHRYIADQGVPPPPAGLRLQSLGGGAFS